MNQTPFAVKVGVLAGAVLLGSGFVYVRAGGRLPGSSKPNAAPAAKVESSRTILPGSKSAAVVLPSETGPKVDPVPNASAKPTANAVLDTSARKVIMSSSKSIILTEPADSPLARVQPAARQPSPLEVAPPVLPPPPSPLEALKKSAQRQSATRSTRPQPSAAPR